MGSQENGPMVRKVGSSSVPTMTRVTLDKSLHSPGLSSVVRNSDTPWMTWTNSQCQVSEEVRGFVSRVPHHGIS